MPGIKQQRVTPLPKVSQTLVPPTYISPLQELNPLIAKIPKIRRVQQHRPGRIPLRVRPVRMCAPGHHPLRCAQLPSDQPRFLTVARGLWCYSR